MYYGGIDLGAKSSQVCIINAEGQLCFNKKLPNNLQTIISQIQRFGDEISVVVESTFNWDWIVYGLQRIGYQVRMAHTLALRAISSAKVKTDKRDAHTLARLLMADMIPTAYIYPEEQRPIRDLLRRRWRIVRQRAEHLRALRFMLYRHGHLHTQADAKKIETDDLDDWFDNADQKLLATFDIEEIRHLDEQIKHFDQRLEEAVRTWNSTQLKNLMSMPGVGIVVALTIAIEIGSIDRFSDARRFSSYCRVVPGCANSAETAKRGSQAKSKQGNPYLKWAFSMAANKAVQFYPEFKQLHQRHLKRHKGAGGKMVAYNTVAHRIAQAAFHILKNNEPYQKEKLFSERDLRNAAMIGK
jgi:transposase